MYKLSTPKTSRVIRIGLFILLFFITWTIRQYIFLSVDSQLIGISKTIVGILFKLTIWFGLIEIYCSFVYREKYQPENILQIGKKGLRYLLVFAWTLILFNLFINLAVNRPLFNISLGVGSFISALIFAPVIEEIMFRGFILSHLQQIIPFWWANFVTAVLFVLIHFPGWIIWGDGVSLESSLSVFAVSLVFGWMAHKTKSLGTPILAHAINNLMSLLM